MAIYYVSNYSITCKSGVVTVDTFNTVFFSYEVIYDISQSPNEFKGKETVDRQKFD